LSQNESIGALIYRISQSSAKALQTELAALGLTGAQFFILRCLSNEIGQTQKALADHLEITSPSLTVMLKPLEEKGLIRRETHSRDARAKLIYLTDQGKEFLQNRIQPIIRQLEEQLLSGFSDHERQLLAGWLDRMVQNVKEYEKECRAARSGPKI
jgi:DNA-binding MarR family transcriptional regulator